MGFFSKQFASVIEWKESSEGTLFWKFQSDEIKKDSRLIVRPGQDAIFLYNGVVELCNRLREIKRDFLCTAG